MSVDPALFQQLMNLVTVSPTATPHPDAANATLWARNEDPASLLSIVTDAPLAYERGGLEHEDELRPRVIAIVGPGATLRGIATLLKPYVDAAGGPNPALSADEIARALLTYLMEYLGGPSLPEWKVGVRLTLPLEIDLGPDLSLPNLSAVGLVTNRGTLATLAAQQATWDLRLDREPSPLPLEDPAAVRSAAQAAAATPTDDLVTALFPRLVTNPYESCLHVVEVLRELRLKSIAGGGLDLVLRLYETALTREPSIMLGATTGGHAVLRCFWRILRAASTGTLTPAQRRIYDAAVLCVAAGLWLEPDGTGWKDPTDVRPGVEAIEPPLTERQRDGGKGGAASYDHPRATEDPGGRRGLALGREITLGTRERYTASGRVWTGCAYGGRLDPDAFRNAHRPDIGTNGAGDPQLAACLDVVVTDAPNEGWLDAVRMADGALLSIGIQQWSVHVNDEATVLLRRFKEREPEQWELHFGTHGLDVRLCGPGADEGSPESDPAVQAANPAAELGTVAPFGRYFPRLAALWGALQPGQPLALLPALGRKPTPTDARLAFFAEPVTGTGTKKDTGVTRLSEAWAARARMATLCSIDLSILQLETAAYRFKRLEILGYHGQVDRAGHPPNGITHPAKELFSSQFGAALILDQSINGPAHVPKAIQAAINRTHATPVHVPGTTKLDPDWEMRFVMNYLAVRRLADKPHRDDWILRNHDQGARPALPGLDPAPGSFKGWP